MSVFPTSVFAVPNTLSLRSCICDGEGQKAGVWGAADTSVLKKVGSATAQALNTIQEAARFRRLNQETES